MALITPPRGIKYIEPYEVYIFGVTYIFEIDDNAMNGKEIEYECKDIEGIFLKLCLNNQKTFFYIWLSITSIVYQLVNFGLVFYT